jgi:Domain of unknown function (DUF5130)
VATGEAFSHEQMDRLNRAQQAAESQTGIRFRVRVGAVDGDVTVTAERLLANLLDGARDPAVLVLVSPGQRFVHIMTSAAARRRINDSAAGLAALTMRSSFALGDLVGGIINGLRQLADTAGAPASSAGSHPRPESHAEPIGDGDPVEAHPSH